MISHLMHDFRLSRCYLKGQSGDQLNLLLTATAWNLRKRMRQILWPLIQGWRQLLQILWNTLPSTTPARR